MEEHEFQEDEDNPTSSPGDQRILAEILKLGGHISEVRQQVVSLSTEVASLKKSPKDQDVQDDDNPITRLMVTQGAKAQAKRKERDLREAMLDDARSILVNAECDGTDPEET